MHAWRQCQPSSNSYTVNTMLTSMLGMMNNDTPLHVASFCGKDEVASTLINEFSCDTKVRGAM